MTIIGHFSESIQTFYKDMLNSISVYASVVDYIERVKGYNINVIEDANLPENTAYVKEILLESKNFGFFVSRQASSNLLLPKRRFDIVTAKYPPIPELYISELLFNGFSGKEQIAARKDFIRSYKYRLVLGHELGHIYFDDFDIEKQLGKIPEINERRATQFGYLLLIARGPVLLRHSLDRLSSIEGIDKKELFSSSIMNKTIEELIDDKKILKKIYQYFSEITEQTQKKQWLRKKLKQYKAF